MLHIIITIPILSRNSRQYPQKVLELALSAGLGMDPSPFGDHFLLVMIGLAE